jgi:hypothetical protein
VAYLLEFRVGYIGINSVDTSSMYRCRILSPVAVSTTAETVLSETLDIGQPPNEDTRSGHLARLRFVHARRPGAAPERRRREVRGARVVRPAALGRRGPASGHVERGDYVRL